MHEIPSLPKLPWSRLLTCRLLRSLKELAPPDLFAHNHVRESSSALNPGLPVTLNCAGCFDAEGWMVMVASAES